MAIFRKMKLPGLKAFGNTVIQYARLQFYSTFAEQLDLFFDSHHFYSIKDCERKRISTQSPIEVLKDTPLSVNINRLDGHQRTKGCWKSSYTRHWLFF